MSDALQHECGVSLLRLRRNLRYYERKYGTVYYGYHKLALLLEKQHNRGQDGAGIAAVGLEARPGRPFYQLEKSCSELSLADLLERIGRRIQETQSGRQSNFSDSDVLAEAYPFCAEVYLGHLRYGTFGNRTLAACHPLVRDNSWRNHTLLLAGNFNLTNTGVLFERLVNSGHHPRSRQDSEILLAQLTHFLEKTPSNQSFGMASADILGILERAAREWDGGFNICGIFGNGDAFALRDAAGIRPAYYYFDDEIAVVASERPAIQTAFDLSSAEVSELPPGHALTVMRNGDVSLKRCLEPAPVRRCVFERIYFSRGNDADIHRERRALGRALAPRVLDAVGHDFENTVFSYIPNTAQIAFHGLLDELYNTGHGQRVRFAQIAVKDAKFRTFITDVSQRRELFPHVYDVTYGVVRPGSDQLVVLDDSIVRGNTLRNAILPMLDRLGPRKIVVVSSAPPVKYPDCYGIDMASFGELVAFEAVMAILRRRGRDDLIAECARNAETDLAGTDRECQNRARPLYDAVTGEELAREIADRLKPAQLRADFEVVFQSCRELRCCCPNHTGDWYFTGNYPTPGGNRVVNRALLNYLNMINQRAY